MLTVFYFCAFGIHFGQCYHNLPTNMSPNSLGNVLRGKIISDYQAGMRQKEIGEKYDVHKSTICRLLKKFQTTAMVDVIHKGGRHFKTTAREDSMIVKHLKRDPYKSSNQIKQEIQLTVSDRTIRRRAVEAGLF